MNTVQKLLAGLSVLTVASSTALTTTIKAKNISTLAESYKSYFNFQTGPSSISGTNDLDNEYLTSFNASAESTYSAYNVSKNDFSHPIFNGDKDNFAKTTDSNFYLSAWKNDYASFQNVLYFKKNLSAYKNIKIGFSDVSKNFKNDELINETKANFEKYILTNNYGLTGVPSNRDVENKKQYVPDAVGGNELDSLYEKVGPSTNDETFPTSNVPFDIWNVWCAAKISENAGVGNHDMKMKISFDYDDNGVLINKEFYKNFKINVENHEYVSDDEFDYNGDGKIDNNDDFGFNAGTYQTRSQKFWTDGKYEGIPNYDIISKTDQDTQNWEADLSGMSALKDKTNLQFVKSYISYGANLKISENNGSLVLNPDNKSLPFTAFFEVLDGEKLVATLSVYNNKYGMKPNTEAYNKPNSGLDSTPDNQENKQDINGDGIVDEKDWDIDGDGKYTREDYYAARPSSTYDGQYDQIGPNDGYGNFVIGSAKQLARFDNSIKPLKEAGASFLRGTGYQDAVDNQLIQYAGRLTVSDSNYDKHQFSGLKDALANIDSLPDSMVSPEQKAAMKKNLEDSAPADDYENLLSESSNTNTDLINLFSSYDANKKPANTSIPPHKWEWTFNFDSLDQYLREAAGNNMTQVLMNPIENNPFRFYFLKDDNAIGPLREIDATKIDSNNKLTEWGKAYVDDVVVPLASALSKHLKDISDDPVYRTNNGKGDPVKVYFQFDEDNEETIDYTMNAVNKATQGYPKIYSHEYLNIASDMFRDFSKNAYDEMINDPNMDQMVLNFYELMKNVGNKNLDSFKQVIHQRSLMDKKTMLYISGEVYPGIFSASDLSGAYWQMFFAYREGMNGIAKWGYDFIYDNYFDKAAIGPKNKNSSFGWGPSGDGFLEYSGSGDQVHWSTRLLALANAERFINKLKQIQHPSKKDGQEFTPDEVKKVNGVVNEIGFGTRFPYPNNDYKYNATVTVPSVYLDPSSEDYSLSISEQVYRLILTIEKI